MAQWPYVNHLSSLSHFPPLSDGHQSPCTLLTWGDTSKSFGKQCLACVISGRCCYYLEICFNQIPEIASYLSLTTLLSPPKKSLCFYSALCHFSTTSLPITSAVASCRPLSFLAQIITAVLLPWAHLLPTHCLAAWAEILFSVSGWFHNEAQPCKFAVPCALWPVSCSDLLTIISRHALVLQSQHGRHSLMIPCFELMVPSCFLSSLLS